MDDGLYIGSEGAISGLFSCHHAGDVCILPTDPIVDAVTIFSHHQRADTRFFVNRIDGATSIAQYLFSICNKI